MNVFIRLLDVQDIETIIASFAKHNWPKPAETFHQYLAEQQLGMRLIWVAHAEGEFAGYVTLKWQSQYVPFQEKNIPEIKDIL